MSDRPNYHRHGRSRRRHNYRNRPDRTEGFAQARDFSYPVDTDDEPATRRQLDELLGAQS